MIQTNQQGRVLKRDMILASDIIQWNIYSGSVLLITAQHTGAVLQFIPQVFDLPADYLWASGTES